MAACALIATASPRAIDAGSAEVSDGNGKRTRRPFFETAAAKYAWLNGIVSVATGHRTASGPTYQVYEVL